MQGHIAEFGCAPEDDVLGEARQIYPDHGEDECGLGGEVAGGGGIHRIVCGCLESEFFGDRIGVEAQRRTRQRACAVGRYRGPLVEVDQSVHVAQQRVRVGEQMVSQQDRLRRLQVCLAGHDRGRVRRRLGGQRRNHVEYAVGDPPHRVAQPQPKQRGHLIVSRPARPQPSTEVIADPIDQPPLQRPVHVLVGDQRKETAVGHVLTEAVQTGQQPVSLFLGQQPGPEQHPCVRLRRGDVIGRKHPVEVGGLAQCRQRVRRTVGEPAAPQGHLRSLRAAIFDDRPCTCTKPFAADWSKVSPSS